MPEPAQAPRPVPAPPETPRVAPSVEPRWMAALMLLVAAIPRVVLLPLNENLYGDAVARTELALRWAAHPHWIASFGDGALQFGPLHLYLIGLMYGLVPDAPLAGRLVSFIFGVLTVLPLYGLTRRLFDWKAAVVACLGFSVWGMHLQMSTTAGSEAVGLFFVAWTLSLFAEGLDERRLAPLLYAALVLNLACAIRYDAWLLMPILALVLLLGDKDRIAAITRAVSFGMFCLSFPLIWMQGNERAFGDPFKPITYIEHFHHVWVAQEIGRLGSWAFRGQGLVFWPGTALLTLSPLLAILGGIGLVKAWRAHPEHRWLTWVVLVPTVYFTFRMVVLANFAPLARFTVDQVALLLPFVYLGFRTLAQGRPRWLGAGLAGLTAITAAALPLWLGAFTFRDSGKWQDMLRPVSPTSTNPVNLMQVARFLKTKVAPNGGSVILDASDNGYPDLQIAFFSGLPESRLARVRWKDFDAQRALAQPRWLVTIDGGKLEKDPRFARTKEGEVRFAHHLFRPVSGFSEPYHVYRRED